MSLEWWPGGPSYDAQSVVQLLELAARVPRHLMAAAGWRWAGTVAWGAGDVRPSWEQPAAVPAYALSALRPAVQATLASLSLWTTTALARLWWS